ncbi:MAG: GNAT family N-acetyltransferase [Hyphomonas sp.]|jgi:RimJ/RimL family protein N-acetyltransferase|uniref:GNAT family N-acetyltransferase n=1 Tax=Hyphomonas sp. TaxID=87 RepID=UPI0037BF9B62|nr:GNAT family N-acetyltransferase [Hyphomonas sp.]
MAGELPLTRNAVSPGTAEAIRAAVRAATQMGGSRLARLEDALGLFALLSDPLVHAPIYTLPRPLTEASVAAFIAMHLEERAAGEGLLFVREGEDGQVMGYSDVQVWPDWGAGELGGALHPSLHGKGAGGRGAAASFAWMFEALGLDLLCETAALDNVATQRMLDGLGFRRMGQTLSTRPDGTTRASLVWEMTRAEWAAQHGFG